VLSVGQGYSRASSYRIDRGGTGITPGPSVDVHDGILQHALEPLTATLFVFEKDARIGEPAREKGRALAAASTE
jgi:hypothetical protein